jgi:hypothetical protein
MDRLHSDTRLARVVVAPSAHVYVLGQSFGTATVFRYCLVPKDVLGPPASLPDLTCPPSNWNPPPCSTARLYRDDLPLLPRCFLSHLHRTHASAA